MIRVNLSIYKKSIKFFYLFDALIKNEIYNKEEFLKSKGITPNSYRRARNIEQRIGGEIILKLSEHFKYNIPSNDLIDDLEKLANSIYNDMYYKIFKNYDYYVMEIENMINKNYNIFPILILLKLLLQINSPNKKPEIMSNAISSYEELKKYKRFFNEGLLKIFELLYLTFEKDTTKHALSEEISDGYSYFILSHRSLQNKKYIDCLYFADKAKNILIKENNLKRIVHLNFDIMNSLNCVKNYKTCLDIAEKQMLALESFDCEGFEKEITLKHMLISALGLKKYELILNLLSDNKILTLTELTCYLYSLSKVSINEYKKYYERNVLEKNNKEFLETLNYYIIHKNRKGILKLENYEINKLVIETLKNA